MRKFKRLTMTLALLIMAVGGAWAQSSLNVVELEEVPAEWATDDNPVTAGDLPGFKASTLAEAQAWTGAPASGMALLFYDFDGAEIKLIIFSGGKNVGSGTQSYLKSSISTSNYKFYYTTEPSEWSLTPDTDKKVWTLDKMPANDIELLVEYYAESNLYLSKEALKDKANISVLNGETAVAFDDEGKSANTVTEGTPMTVTYTGTKKVIGVKAEKKGAPKYADVVTICEKNGDNRYLISSFFDGTNANITTITKEEAIALAEYLGGGDILVVYEEYEYYNDRYVMVTNAAGNVSGLTLSTTNTCNVPLYYVPAGN